MVKSCRFCRENGLLVDTALYENKSFYVLGSIDPTRLEAVMIIPHRHIETPFDMTPEEWSDMADALAFAKNHLSPHAPDGFTVGWNVGAAAGQTVFHAHLHVITRYATDGCVGRGIHGLLKLGAAEQS